MKKTVLSLLSILMVLTSAGCMLNDAEQMQETSQTEETYLLSPQMLPLTFSSHEEYAEYKKQNGSKTSARYFIPENIPETYTFSHITTREGTYISVYYRVTLPEEDLAGLSDYDAERLQTLICQYSLRIPNEQALAEQYLGMGYQAIQYGDLTVYRWDEPGGGVAGTGAIGYEVAFMYDGAAIFMHLPAIDTFENMMEFTKLTKIVVS